MKAFTGFVFFLTAHLLFAGVKVTGVAKVDGQFVALFEMLPTDPKHDLVRLILKPDESDNKLAFDSFDPVKGEVHYAYRGQSVTVPWLLGDATFEFKDIAVAQALEFYSQRANRTAVCPVSHLGKRLSIRSTEPLPQGLNAIPVECRKSGLFWREIGKKYIAVGEVAAEHAHEQFFSALEETEQQQREAKGDRTMINFDRMPLGQVLRMYSEMAKRIVIRPANVPTTQFITLKQRQPATMIECSALLETVMALNGFITTHAGEKFALVAREGDMPGLGDTIKNATGRLIAAEQATGAASDVTFSFDNMPLGHVLEYYAELTKRTLITSDRLPLTTFITLASKDRLTQPEAAAAIESVLMINHFAITHVGEKFAVVGYEGNAQNDKPIIDTFAAALKKADETGNSPLADPINWKNTPLLEACALYAAIVGKPLDPAASIPNSFVRFKTASKLTQSETVAALDALFALHGIKIIPATDDRLTVIKR